MERMLRKILKKEKKEIEVITRIDRKGNYFHIFVNFFYDDELLAALISKETFKTIEEAEKYLAKAKNDDLIEYRAFSDISLI